MSSPNPPAAPAQASVPRVPPAAPAPDAGLKPDPQEGRQRDLDFDQVAEIDHLFGRLRLNATAQVRGVGAVQKMATPLPPSTSLRPLCGQVRDQGTLNSCTAHAAVALTEVIQARFNQRVLAGSPMFVYKASRDILRWNGDAGAYLRTAAGALAMLGVVPEAYWPYEISMLDQNPPPFCYQLAQQFRATRYFRIDSDGVGVADVLHRMKRLLVHGLPSMLGYSIFFGAEYQARATADIVLPLASDIQTGRHALMVCGYDDERVITNSFTGGASCSGAFLVQNSHGTGWGDQGFGWLPYAYFEHGWVSDVWSVVTSTIADLAKFGEDDPVAPAPVPSAGS